MSADNHLEALLTILHITNIMRIKLTKIGKVNIIDNNYEEFLERLMRWASLARMMPWLVVGMGEGDRTGIEREGGRGRGGGGSAMDGTLEGGRKGEGLIVGSGGNTSLFFVKQIRHFPPKNGFCSDSRPLPQSKQIILLFSAFHIL